MRSEGAFLAPLDRGQPLLRPQALPPGGAKHFDDVKRVRFSLRRQRRTVHVLVRVGRADGRAAGQGAGVPGHR